MTWRELKKIELECELLEARAAHTDLVNFAKREERGLPVSAKETKAAFKRHKAAMARADKLQRQLEAGYGK